MSLTEEFLEGEGVSVSSLLHDSVNIHPLPATSASAAGRSWLSTLDTKAPRADRVCTELVLSTSNTSINNSSKAPLKQTDRSLKRNERNETASLDKKSTEGKRIKLGKKVAPLNKEAVSQAQRDETIRAQWNRNRSLYEVADDADCEPDDSSSPHHHYLEAEGPHSDSAITSCHSVLNWIEMELQRIHTHTGKTFELTDADIIM